MRGLGAKTLEPIRCRGALHCYAARAAGRAPALVVTAPRIPPDQARAALSDVARVHRAAAGEHVPAVLAAELDGDAPWVLLDCDVVADGDHVADIMLETARRAPHPAGAALIIAIMRTIARVHERGACLGSFARANILLANDGRMWLLCGGAPLADAYLAPEVACGGPPTQSADVYSILGFLRGQIALTEMHPLVQRVFAGRLEPRDHAFAARVAWSARVQGLSPSERPAMQTVLDHIVETWRMLDFTLDYAEYARWVSGLLAAGPERLADATPSGGSPCIRLGRAGEWLETPNGMRHSLHARRPLRRVLLALAEARRDRSGAALTVDELLQAGWPGENPLPDAGSNRVYVTIAALRQLGLSDLLQRWDGGYRIDPGAQLQLEA